MEIKRVIEYPDGTKKAKHFYGKTKREAIKKYEQFLVELQTEKRERTIAYFSEVADDYLESRGVGGTTYVGYKNKIDIMKSKFGDRLIDTFTYGELQKYLNSMSDLSENTIKKYRTHLKGIFKYAVKQNIIDSSPADDLVIPVNCQAPKSPRWYTKEQARQLINHSKDMGVKGLSVFIPLKCGTRPGETAAIDIVRDVNFVDYTITIRETIKTPQSGEKVGKTKTRSSQRVIPVDDEFIEHIRKFKKKGYLFDNGNGKPVNYNNFQDHYIDPVLNSTDLPRYTPHELRHTFGTLLYECGTDLYDIMAIMGHSDIKATQIYVHQDRKELAKRIKRDF